MFPPTRIFDLLLQGKNDFIHTQKMPDLNENFFPVAKNFIFTFKETIYVIQKMSFNAKGQGIVKHEAFLKLLLCNLHLFEKKLLLCNLHLFLEKEDFMNEQKIDE